MQFKHMKLFLILKTIVMDTLKEITSPDFHMFLITKTIRERYFVKWFFDISITNETSSFLMSDTSKFDN